MPAGSATQPLPQYNAAMHKPVILRGPIPTPEQMADELGVSRAHLEELRALLEEQGILKKRRGGNSPPATARAADGKKASVKKVAQKLARAKRGTNRI